MFHFDALPMPASLVMFQLLCPTAVEWNFVLARMLLYVVVP